MNRDIEKKPNVLSKVGRFFSIGLKNFLCFFVIFFLKDSVVERAINQKSNTLLNWLFRAPEDLKFKKVSKTKAKLDVQRKSDDKSIGDTEDRDVDEQDDAPHPEPAKDSAKSLNTSLQERNTKAESVCHKSGVSIDDVRREIAKAKQDPNSVLSRMLQINSEIASNQQNSALQQEMVDLKEKLKTECPNFAKIPTRVVELSQLPAGSSLPLPPPEILNDKSSNALEDMSSTLSDRGADDVQASHIYQTLNTMPRNPPPLPGGGDDVAGLMSLFSTIVDSTSVDSRGSASARSTESVYEEPCESDVDDSIGVASTSSHDNQDDAYENEEDSRPQNLSGRRPSDRRALTLPMIGASRRASANSNWSQNDYGTLTPGTDLSNATQEEARNFATSFDNVLYSSESQKVECKEVGRGQKKYYELKIKSLGLKCKVLVERANNAVRNYVLEVIGYYDKDAKKSHDNRLPILEDAQKNINEHDIQYPPLGSHIFGFGMFNHDHNSDGSNVRRFKDVIGNTNTNQSRFKDDAAVGLVVTKGNAKTCAEHDNKDCKRVSTSGPSGGIGSGPRFICTNCKHWSYGDINPILNVVHYPDLPK